MYCSNCGQPLKDGVNFCSNCGMKITWPAVSEEAVPPVSIQAEEPAAVTEETAAEVPAEETPAVPESKLVTPEKPAEETETVPEESAEAKDAAAESEPETESAPEENVPETAEPETETVSEEPAVPAEDAEAADAVPEKSAEEVPAEKEVTKTAKPEKKPKKKTLLYIGIAAALIIAGIFGYNMLPGAKFKRAVTAAETALAAGDYTVAAEEYEKALTIRPQDAEISLDAMGAFAMHADEMISDGQLKEALAYVEKVLPLVTEEDQPPLLDICKNIYGELAEELIYEQDYTGAKALLQEGLDKGYDLEYEMQSAKTAEEYSVVLEDMRGFLKDAAAKLDTDDYDGALNLFQEKYGEILTNDTKYGFYGPVIAEISGGKYKKAGFYSSDGYYGIYYGDYDGTMREGSGMYIVYYENASAGRVIRYHAACDWQDDVPEGPVTEYIKIYTGSNLDADNVVNATVKGGLYHGNVECNTGEDVFNGSFTDGIANVIDTVDPNGESTKVIMYNSDKSSWRFFNNEEAYSRTFGMPGFAAIFN